MPLDYLQWKTCKVLEQWIDVIRSLLSEISVWAGMENGEGKVRCWEGVGVGCGGVGGAGLEVPGQDERHGNRRGLGCLGKIVFFIIKSCEFVSNTKT